MDNTMSRYWQGPTLSVIGLGLAENQCHLHNDAQAALRGAELVIGTEHYLSVVSEYIQGAMLVFPTANADIWSILRQNFNKKIVILTSGDPLCFGLGTQLRSRLSPNSLKFYSNLSSVQVAFSRIGQPWTDAKIINLAKLPPSSLRAQLGKNRWYAVLTHINTTPQAIALELCHNGFPSSPMWVMECLGRHDEEITFDYADALLRSNTTFVQPNIVVFQTQGAGLVVPENIGIIDTAFETDGDASKGLAAKREVRVNILSLLSTHTGDICWDVGAGCGQMSIEWAKWHPDASIHAIEYNKERAEIIRRNRDQFGVMQNLEVFTAAAPPILDDLPAPDAIFVGGGGSDSRFEIILDVCWERLKPGGRMVAAAITEDTKMRLYRYAENTFSTVATEGFEVSISHLAKLNGRRILNPQLPVLLLKWTKP